MKSYLDASRGEIMEQAALLIERSLRNYYGDESEKALQRLQINPKDKGALGNVVEVLHFGLELNQRPGPDFIAAGIELKTTGFKTLQSGQLVAKERLPLGMINYMRYKDPAQCDFETGGILYKSRLLLLMAYLYEANVEIVDLVFRLIDLWEFPESDLEIIRQDWKVIMDKIRGGKAHELSEGDTFYLSTSTAGGGHGRVQDQPFSTEKAKPRKFSLKQPYLNHIFAVLSGKVGQNYGRFISDADLLKQKKSFEQIVLEMFEKFKGMSLSEMADSLGIVLNPTAKHFAALLTKAVLQIHLDAEIEEFDKAGIIIKTVRLEPNDKPRQSISFPAFEYTHLVNETWETSDFKNYLDSKFLLVFFQYDGAEDDSKSTLYFKKAVFWNMPDTDIDVARDAWERTVRVVREGQIVRGFATDRNGKVTRITRFPGMKDNPVAHARPHGSDAKDTYRLPVPDKHTGESEYTKYCFWINNNYVRDNIYHATQ